MSDLTSNDRATNHSGFAPPLMRFDPATGEARPYPSETNQWRDYNGQCAWLFNPWTGARRDARDVGSDPFGHLIGVNRI